MYRDNALVHSGKLVEEYLEKRSPNGRPPHYSPDLADFDCAKSEKGADGVPMTPQEFKKEWGQLLRETAEGEIANAISRWLGPVRIAFASTAVMLINHKK
jgi:hypothetical protein